MRSTAASAATPTTSAIVAEAVAGSHVVEIMGYSLLKGLGNGKFVTSGEFSLGGHRWCVRYYPDGNMESSADWISIFLQHDPTDDDAVQVRARVQSISVLDDSDKPVPGFSCKCSAMRTFSAKNRTWGFEKVAQRKALEESSCIRDDCLRVRCDTTVQTVIRTEATTKFVVMPPSNMNQHFGHILLSAEGVDVKFEVAGEKFTAHRCVLAARSPVFKVELFGSMKEKAMDLIPILDMEARVFKAMLHFIYTDDMPDVDKGDEFEMAQHLLEAADRYDLERLKLICEEKLCNGVDTNNVATTLALAEQHGCRGLKKACFKLLESPSHLNTAMATEGFEHLMSSCPSLVKELLTKFASCLRSGHQGPARIRDH